MDNLSSVLNTLLLLVAVVAALAPLIVALLPGPRVPQIVLLIIGGIVIGPQGFGLSDPAALILIANIGLGLVFLLAGYELDPAVFRERAGRLALTGWVAPDTRYTGHQPGIDPKTAIGQQAEDYMNDRTVRIYLGLATPS